MMNNSFLVLRSFEADGGQWRPIGGFGGQSRPMKDNGDQWRLIEAN